MCIRDSYETHPADRPRQCVFGGTSNALDFLPLDLSLIHISSGLPMRTGNRRERQKSPSPGRNPRRNSFRKQKTIASVSLPIISTYSECGERNMPRTPQRKSFIPGLWKPYRSKTKWNICWICCCSGRWRKKMCIRDRKSTIQTVSAAGYKNKL